MKDLISVMIPMYNSEAYIYETIKAALLQSYKPIEILVMDDGSTDKSAQIVESMIKEYGESIKYFRENNSGVSATRNKGIKKAKGKWIAFLDSDDLWLPTKLEKQMEVLNKTGMKISYCGYSDFFETSKLIKKQKTNFAQGKILIELLKNNTWCQTSTWIIEKAFMEENNIWFNEACSWGEDYEFFLKIAALTEISCPKEHLMLYRIRPESISTGKNPLDKAKDYQVWIRLSEWMEENSNRIEYKDLSIIKKLIWGFRIPNTIIEKVYNALRNPEALDSKKDFEKIRVLLKSEYVKGLKMNNGVKTLRIYTKIVLIHYKLRKYKK